jgi:hypothetical protein
MKRGKSRMMSRKNLLKQYQKGNKRRAYAKQFDYKRYDGHAYDSSEPIPT